MATPSNPAEITLFGATGFTGRQIARVLARENLPFRIAGRSAERLAALSAELPDRPAWIAADAAQPSTLAQLFKGTRLLINCAGPFTDLGERVIAQAALSGTHYLDITNELGYVFRARGYQQVALKSGAALVPACGFEVALADCLAHQAGTALHPTPEHPLDSLDVLYQLGGQASRGTRRSIVRTLGTSWIAYRDGQWTGQMPGGRTRRFDLSGASIPAISIPSCESITVPAHLPVRRVDVWNSVSPLLRAVAPLVVPLLARLSRSMLRGLVLRIAERGGLSTEAAPEAAGDAPFSIYARAARGDSARALSLTGRGPYPLTAEIIAYFARQMLQPGFDRRGMLAPAQAVDPADFLAYAQEHWELALQAP